MLVEDMTSAILNPTPTGDRNSLTATDRWNPGDTRVAFTYGPTGPSNRKKKKKNKLSKVKPFKRPPVQGLSTGANYSGK